MLGRKVSELRRKCGLSQHQLAGKDMTRALISQIETGRCKPSLETLSIIAERLGKPVEYFLAEQASEVLSAWPVVVRTAQEALERGALQEARGQVLEALRLGRCADQPELEATAHLLHGTYLRKAGLLPEAHDALEQALDCQKRLGNRPGMVLVHMEMGHCAFAAADFARARRIYEKVLVCTEGSKSLQEHRARAYLYLGTVLYRLDQWQAATQAYRDSQACSSQNTRSEVWAEAAMGLGWVHYKLGETEPAIAWTRKAYAVFHSLGTPAIHEVKHNLAIMEMSRGNWEQSYSMLRECMASYREQRLTLKHASTLEDMSHYFLHKKNGQKARKVLEEALALLAQQDDGLLRARVYRNLGHVEAQVGRVGYARLYMLMSYELFRQLNAHSEANISLQWVNSLTGPAPAEEGARAGAGAQPPVYRSS